MPLRRGLQLHRKGTLTSLYVAQQLKMNRQYQIELAV
jgi:hypothetical protein